MNDSVTGAQARAVRNEAKRVGRDQIKEDLVCCRRNLDSNLQATESQRRVLTAN